MEEVANAAVLSAKSILRKIVSDSEMQLYLDGLPLYFHTMIAFAVVFLLKVTVKYKSLVRVDSAEILNLIDEAVYVLNAVSSRMHEQHLLGHIAAGTSKLLARCRQALSDSAVSEAPESNDHTAHERQPVYQSYWSPLDSTWLENYDLLSTQNMDSTLDSWSLDFNIGQPIDRVP